jgi:short-subunit dehydrogenase
VVWTALSRKPLHVIEGARKGGPVCPPGFSYGRAVLTAYCRPMTKVAPARHSSGPSGIGREVVSALLSRGARVAALDLREESLTETTRVVGTNSERLSTHVVDISNREAVEQAPDAVISAHGQVDGLLNVAGIIQQFTPFVDLPYAEMERVMAVNFWGVVNTTKAFLPHLLGRPEACVVNVSSMGGLAPVPGQTMYGASKAAVKLMTEGLYAELRDTTVAVTVVFPGGVATAITDNSGVTAPISPDDAAAQSMKLTSPQDAARQIVAGVENGSYRVVIGGDARMLDRISRLAPRRATDMIAKRMAGLVGS